MVVIYYLLLGGQSLTILKSGAPLGSVFSWLNGGSPSHSSRNNCSCQHVLYSALLFVVVLVVSINDCSCCQSFLNLSSSRCHIHLSVLLISNRTIDY